MKRTVIASLAVAAVSIAMAVESGHAADRTRIGTMSIAIEGEVAGAERYEIVFREDGNVRASGTVSLAQGNERTDVATDLRLKGPDGTFESFQLEADINELPNTLSITFDGKQARAKIISASARRDEEIDIRPDTLIVENTVFHLYQLVADRYDFKKGGRQAVHLFIGTSLKPVDATMEFKGRAPVSIGDKTYNGRRLFLDMQSFGVYVWVDDNGELMRVEVPIQGVVATRADYSGLPTEARAGAKYQPMPELAYREVRFKSGEYELAGTISAPRGTQGRLPGIVFINDTGPQDRNGFVPRIDLYIGTGELLDKVSAAGFVVLRYDEPGVGKSGGEFGVNTLGATKSDVAAALDFLAKQPEVDPARLAVIGHGEGAEVAIRVAADRPGLNAIALLAPSAMPLDELAIWQVKRRLAEDGEPPDAWKTDPVVTTLDRARISDEKVIVVGMKPVYLDVFRELIATNPQAEIAKVKIPLFIAEAGNDAQLPANQGDLLSQAASRAGNGNVRQRSFSGLDHFFRKGTGELADYSNETEPIDGAFIKELASWLAEVLK